MHHIVQYLAIIITNTLYVICQKLQVYITPAINGIFCYFDGTFSGTKIIKNNKKEKEFKQKVAS